MAGLHNRNLYVKLHVQFGFTLKQLRELVTSAAPKPKPKKRRNPDPALPVEKQSKSFGLDKNEKRLLRQKLLEANENTDKHHLFKQMCPWRTKLALAQHLKESEVYNNDGLIALCKPYGVAKVKVEDRSGGIKTVVQTLNSGAEPVNAPAIEAVLPVLQEMYKVDHLELVKTTERWSSGLMLLSTRPEMTERILKCFRRSKAQQQPPLTYWAVTNGLPNPSVGACKVAISLENVKELGKIPVIRKNYTSAEIKRGDSKLAVVEHSTVMHNKKAKVSLVEVNIQTVKWSFLKVWLAHSYSPVLGDAVYGGRIKIVSGKKVQVSPHNVTAYQPQNISSAIYKKLQLPKDTAEMIPCLIHLASIKLAQFNKDKSDLILNVPPPKHFMWACTQLGLMSTNLPTREEDDISES